MVILFLKDVVSLTKTRPSCFWRKGTAHSHVTKSNPCSCTAVQANTIKVVSFINNFVIAEFITIAGNFISRSCGTTILTKMRPELWRFGALCAGTSSSTDVAHCTLDEHIALIQGAAQSQ